MHLNIIAIAFVICLAWCFLVWFFVRKRKDKAKRQCAYGNIDIYHILQDPTDYQALKRHLSSLNSHDERYLVSVGISRLYPVELLERWVREEPDSADALLCYGARLVQISWNVRGYGRGSDVGDGKWRLFFDKLDQTREVLERCAAARPTDPTPWAYLIMVSTWHSDDHETRSYYFEQATARDPYNWPAHMHMIIALSEKWGGDNDEMVAFAEAAANNAPEGNDLPAILIKAYIEYWKYMDMFQDKPKEAEQFINTPDIKEKAAAAYVRSLGSDKHTETAVSIFARYNTSAWFWMVKDRERLQRDLNVLGSKIENIHWRWAGPEGELGAARRFANSK